MNRSEVNELLSELKKRLYFARKDKDYYLADQLKYRLKKLRNHIRESKKI